MTTIKLRLVTLSGPLETLSESEVNSADAMAIVKAHAESGGYRNVKQVSEDDGYSVRYTATTPGGRHGRNIAFGDY